MKFFRRTSLFLKNLLVFKNGETKLYDCKPLLDFGVFQELNDLNYFLSAKVEHGTVVWPHEQDICPDTLYLEGKEIEKEGSAVC